MHINRRATDRYTAVQRLVRWPLMGVLLHLVQQQVSWLGCGLARSYPRYTKCNSPPIDGRCTNLILFGMEL